MLVSGRTLKAAIEGCQNDRDALEEKEEATRVREGSGLRNLIAYDGNTHLRELDAKWLNDFGTCAKNQTQKALEAKATGLPEG
jgi:hypothetical protein